MIPPLNTNQTTHAKYQTLIRKRKYSRKTKTAFP